MAIFADENTNVTRQGLIGSQGMLKTKQAQVGFGVVGCGVLGKVYAEKIVEAVKG